LKRFLLISDIHAADVDPSSSKAPSYVSTHKPAGGSAIDPLDDLESLIKSERLAPDAILCPGDITDKSKPAPFSYAWGRLHQLSSQCGAKLFATVGNHDVDSRFKSNSFDPRGFAMSLLPTIPSPQRLEYLEYWAENFTVISTNGCNILIINTAAYHGTGIDAAREIEHGRISDATLTAVESALIKLPEATVNIALCHHHVIKPADNDGELEGQTRGAEKLVDILNKAAEPWIIIHGHKHVPDLFYGHGGSNAPVILGCASFSAQVNEDARNKNPNQVHLLVCDPDGAKSAGLASGGYILSWTWQPGVGWRRAKGIYGLPYFAGFGNRTSVSSLVIDVERALTSASQNALTWAAAAKAVPLIERLIPTDFVLFEKALNKKNLVVLTDTDGAFAQIGRRA